MLLKNTFDYFNTKWMLLARAGVIIVSCLAGASLSRADAAGPAVAPAGNSWQISGNCSDPQTGLQAVLKKAQLGDTIVISSASQCAGTFVFPNNTGQSGSVVIAATAGNSQQIVLATIVPNQTVEFYVPSGSVLATTALDASEYCGSSQAGASNSSGAGINCATFAVDTGQTVGAVPSLSSTTLAFGNQNVGTLSQSQSVVLSNSGDAALNISDIVASGPNSADFAVANSCPAALPSGSSCTISVIFSPAAAGYQTAQLTIVDGSPSSPAVSLTGVGLNNVQTPPQSNPSQPNPQSNSPQSNPALRFVPVTPCRVADTRYPDGAFGSPILEGQSSRDFVIPNSQCGIPNTAQAYALNITAVPTGGLGYVTVWPAGQPQPILSTLNSEDGRVKANAAIVPAGANGAISVFATQSTHIVLDITGYFALATENTSALAFFPLTPCRVVNTRLSDGLLGGPYLAGGTVRSFPILQSGCNIPPSAQAYSLNFTAIPREGVGYLTAWPAGQPQPVASVLNAPTSSPTANAAIIPAGSAGDVSVLVSNDADLIIDINGYFAPDAGGLSLYNVTPCRAFNSRLNQGSPSFSGTLNIDLTGQCGASSSAQAYVLNATVAPDDGLGYLTLWASGQPWPVASTLNAVDGFVASNLAITPTTNGNINALASNPSALILDLFGYFAP